VRTSASEASQRYPAAVIVMHWAIAAAVVGPNRSGFSLEVEAVTDRCRGHDRADYRSMS
jgi:hypothetical protein